MEIAALALLLLGAPPRGLLAQQAAVSPQCKHDIWIIDSHSVGHSDADARNARFLRLDDNQNWISESEEGFLNSLSSSRSVNYVLPGYMSDLSLGIEQVWTYHHQLNRYTTAEAGYNPTRVVLWAWPSERQGLAILRDARAKGARAEREGIWLSQHLSKLPQEYRANLLAHSFGARIAISAAHHLASASNSGGVNPRNSLHLTGALIAPAVDSDSLEPGQPYQLALGRFEKLLLVNNSNDRVLKRYRLLDRSKRPEAMGRIGLAIPDSGLAGRIEQMDANQIVGPAHHWHQHLASSAIMAKIAPLALSKDPVSLTAKRDEKPSAVGNPVLANSR